MINRFVMGLLCAAACSAQACAAEAPNAQDAQQAQDLQSASAKIDASPDLGFDAPAEAWRDVDAENLIIIDTAYGKIGVELYPEISPNHVERIKTLTRNKFYDNVKFHRVIDGFMNQTGDGTNGDGTGDSDLPNLQAEFTFRRSTDMAVTLVSAREVGQKSIDVGFFKALPIATQPINQAFLTKDGKVGAFGLHCKGVTSMARTGQPHSANSQFFLMRGTAEHLDAQYSVWGNTVMGFKYLERPKVGAVGQDPGFVPDQMNTVRVAADLPETERPRVQVMKTDSPAFQAYLKTKKNTDGTYPDICDIPVPSRTL